MVENKKNAVIVSLKKDISEIKDLADTLGYKVIETFFQTRNTPDAKSYFGSGKVKEIADFISNFPEDIALVIVDGRLKPSQWFHLEKRFGCEVYDRVRVILNIFEQRAESKEARLQVKLAQLEYERPFVRELIHRSKKGEHPGLMAGGEYQVDDYYEMIKKQMKKIREELENIRDERELRRRHRHVGGFYLVSFAGYTNAGKSSLLNLLSEGDVQVEGKLFSTLSTTTRRLNKETVPILLTDTVGFIQDLPALIVDAFHSTLEELSVADVVLLVVDVSEDPLEVEHKLGVSMDELMEIGVSSPIIVVLNKIDLISESELERRLDVLEDSDLLNEHEMIPVSALEKENIDALLDLIYDSLPALSKLKVRLPFNEEVQSFVSWIYDRAHVVDIDYKGGITVVLECGPDVKGKIEHRCSELGGSVIS
ncbi:MAG: GTPase HflX [Candidatus Thermoplasmatota archaeon]